MEWVSGTAAVTLLTAMAGVVKSTVLCILVAIVIRLTRMSATARHVVWMVALASCVLLSLVPVSGMAAVEVGVPAWADISLAAAVGVGLTTGPFEQADNGLLAVWILGALILAGVTLRDAFAARALVRRSSPVSGFSSPGPRVAVTDELRLPAVGGVWRPVVLVPFTARDVLGDASPVLVHEFAHALRRDPLSRLVTRLLCSVVWFNPVCWWIARRVVLEQELACDDAVVRRGFDRFHYARQLVDLSQFARTSDARGMAGLFSRSSALRLRVRCLLSAPDPRDTRRWVTCGVVAFVAVAASLGMSLTPVEGRLTVLPVRNGTLVVKGPERQMVLDMWPTEAVVDSSGRLRIELRTIDTARVLRERRAR